MDYDQPAESRYNEIFEHFKEDLIDLENIIYGSMHDEYKQFFSDNLDKLEET